MVYVLTKVQLFWLVTFCMSSQHLCAIVTLFSEVAKTGIINYRKCGRVPPIRIVIHIVGLFLFYRRLAYTD